MKAYRCEPELRGHALAHDVHMRWLSTIPGVEEEPVRTRPVDRWHFGILRPGRRSFRAVVAGWLTDPEFSCEHPPIGLNEEMLLEGKRESGWLRRTGGCQLKRGVGLAGATNQFSLWHFRETA